MTRTRIAVLASGGGSNLHALCGFFAQLGAAGAGEIVLVASDRAEAGALVRARQAGIATAVLASGRDPGGVALPELLSRHDVELLVLAGYLRLVPTEVTRRFAGRLVNVHPAPLPRFGGAGMYGARVHRAVLAAGATLSGPTVHFVDEIYDHGAAIAHWPVPVMPGDDEHTLAARVLRAEQLLLPRVVQALAAGDVRTDASGALIAPFFLPQRVLPMDHTLDDASLAALLDDARAV